MKTSDYLFTLPGVDAVPTSGTEGRKFMVHRGQKDEHAPSLVVVGPRLPGGRCSHVYCSSRCTHQPYCTAVNIKLGGQGSDCQCYLLNSTVPHLGADNLTPNSGYDFLALKRYDS